MSSRDIKKKALLIAISEYEDYDPLDFCKNDGELMYKTLIDLGYDIPAERKIIGKVDHKTFDDAVKEFFRGNHIKGNDTLLFYYTGHGAPSGDSDYYFVTSKTERLRPDVNGYDYDNLTKLSRKSKSKKIIKIIDCCYSGALDSPKSDESSQALIGKNTIDKKFANEGQGNYVLASSLATQESSASSDGSLSEFTFHIVNGLNGSDKNSVDKNGFVTPHTLGKYAYEKMIDLELAQQPINNTQASGDIFLAHYPNLSLPPQEEEIRQRSEVEIRQRSEVENIRTFLTSHEKYGSRSFDEILKSQLGVNPDELRNKILPEAGAIRIYPPGKEEDELWGIPKYVVTKLLEDKDYTERSFKTISSYLKEIEDPNEIRQLLRNLRALSKVRRLGEMWYLAS